MSNEIERLPRLLARAVATLEKATTAAEILDAREAARIAYDQGTAAARLAKMKGAHDAVIIAIRKAQADALAIEARAQCRLADEYDAAQERGEVAKRTDGTAIRDHVPGKNKVATVTDIGLTRKLVHEARQIRDAEKAKPGIIRKALDEQLAAGKEPTRADMKRAIENRSKSSKGRGGAVKLRNPISVEDREQLARDVLDDGKTVDAAARQAGVSVQIVKTAVEREKGRRAAEPIIRPEDLSMTAQQKLSAAIRQAERKIDDRVRELAQKRYREALHMFLPELQDRETKARMILDRHKGIMPRSLFRKILACLESSQRKAVTDNMMNEAFMGFKQLEAVLVARETPIAAMGIPSNVTDWDELRRKKREMNRAKRTGKSAVNVR